MPVRPRSDAKPTKAEKPHVEVENPIPDEPQKKKPVLPSRSDSAEEETSVSEDAAPRVQLPAPVPDAPKKKKKRVIFPWELTRK